MKKIMAVLAVGILGLSLTACVTTGKRLAIKELTDAQKLSCRDIHAHIRGRIADLSKEDVKEVDQNEESNYGGGGY
jgi:hypothetical protein